MQLQYDQKIPPPHNLNVENYDTNFDFTNVSVKKLPSQGLTLKYSPNDQYIAIGCKNGSRLLYSLQQHKIIQRFDCTNDNSVTCVRWRPNTQGKYNVLATTDADGNLNYWHVPSMKKIFNLRQDDNSILCMDFQKKGQQFATAGKDCAIRIYDQQTKSLTITCKGAGWNNIGHDNRVFSVKYIDDKTLISGGWDSVVHVWDIREGKSVRHFLGPHISGDSLDCKDGKILAGCYAPKNQIHVYSLSTCQKIQQIDWTNNIDQAQYIYTAGYSSYSPGIFGAGSTGPTSEVRLFKEMQNKKHKKIVGLKGINQGVFSLDFANKHEQIAFATAHHGFYVYDLKKNK